MPVHAKTDELGSGQRPLSPSESGAAQTAQQSIDVKSEDQKPTNTGNADGVRATGKSESSTVPIVVPRSESKPKGRPRKSDVNHVNSKPYQGLFTAVINDTTPPVVEIQDLRENVAGGEKTWTEPIHCLLCHAEIH